MKGNSFSCLFPLVKGIFNYCYLFIYRPELLSWHLGWSETSGLTWASCLHFWKNTHHSMCLTWLAHMRPWGQLPALGGGSHRSLQKCSVNTLAIKPSRKKGQPKPSLTSSAPCHGHPQPPRVSFYRWREKQSPAVDHNPKVCHPLTSALWPPATMLLVISSAWNSGYLSYLHLPIGHVWQKPGSLA